MLWLNSNILLRGNVLLAGNKRCCIWGIESSPNGHFCQEEEETVEHLFWYCSTTGIFWLGVQKWRTKYNIQLQYIDMFTILLGKLSETGPAKYNYSTWKNVSL